MLDKRFLRVVTTRSLTSDTDRELKRDAERMNAIREAYNTKTPTAANIKEFIKNHPEYDDFNLEAKEEDEEEYEAAVVVGKVRRLFLFLRM